MCGGLRGVWCSPYQPPIPDGSLGGVRREGSRFWRKSQYLHASMEIPGNEGIDEGLCHRCQEGVPSSPQSSGDTFDPEERGETVAGEAKPGGAWPRRRTRRTMSVEEGGLKVTRLDDQSSPLERPPPAKVCGSGTDLPPRLEPAHIRGVE